MKAMTIIVIAIMMILSPAIYAEETSSDSKAEAVVDLSSGDTRINSSNPFIVQQVAQLPQSAQPTLVGFGGRDNRLPSDLAEASWSVYDDQELINFGISVKALRAFSSNWFLNWFSGNDYRLSPNPDVHITNTAKNDNDIVRVLSRKPSDLIREAGRIFLNLDSSEEDIYIKSRELLETINDEIGCRYALIAKRQKLLTEGKSHGLGTAAAGAAQLGGSANPGEQVAGVGAGSLWGEFTSQIAPQYNIAIVCYNMTDADIPTEVVEEPVAMRTEKETPVVEKVKTVVLDDEPKLKSVLFDFNSDKIRDDQKDNLKQIAENIYSGMDDLGSNEKIQAIGGASPEGKSKHNNDLGMRRSKQIVIWVANYLYQNYGVNLQRTYSVFTYASDGANFLDSQEADQNRRVYIQLGTRLTK